MRVAAGKPRQRAWKPKNRTGCKTCKIRKVKCDEEKPSCKRCTSTGRKCDGYDPNFSPAHLSSTSPPPFSARSQLLPDKGQALARSVSPISIAPALLLTTAKEHDSFEFFTTYAVSALSGFVDSPFWQREILQAAHQHESIKHCVIALGAMHRRFYEGHKSNLDESDITDERLQFALQKSNQAIQGLIKETGSRSKVKGADRITLMTCCILFSNMACLQGHQRDGLLHLKSGIRMLNEMDQEENTQTDSHAVNIESLRSIFVGLDMQARSIMSSKDIRSWEPMPRTTEVAVPYEVELSHVSMLSMQRYLQSLFDHVLVFLQGTVSRPIDETEAISREYQPLLSRFINGTYLLEKLVAKASQTNDNFTQSLNTLQLLHSQIEYYVRVPRPDLGNKFSFLGSSSSTPFDITAHFTRMLDFACRLLPHSDTMAPVFTTSNGPLSALWLVATRAPSECIMLRKRAVRLMLSHPRREGFWDGLMAGQIAQEVLRLEQMHTQEELGLLATPTRDLIVPLDLRNVAVTLSYDEENDRRARVEYRNMRQMLANEPGSVQWLQW